jgi:lantibiotic modifying enzyme
MEEFNYNSTYSSGWRQIKREETENEQQRALSHPNKEHGAPIRSNKPLSEEPSSKQKKVIESTAPIPIFEENQKEIISKINQLQTEMASMKQLLHSIQENSQMIGPPSQRKAPGSKFSRLFK